MNKRGKIQSVGPDLYLGKFRRYCFVPKKSFTSTRNKLLSNMYWPTYTYCTGIPLSVRDTGHGIDRDSDSQELERRARRESSQGERQVA